MKNRVPSRLPVPAFTPVPRKCARHDGWTAERQQAFLDALAETGSVKHACARINMAAEGAYALRRAPGAESFAKAWDAALDHGVQQLRDIAIDRAKDGVEVPIYSYGKLVGTRRVHNDRLLMFCVKHGLGRLGADDPAPLGRGTRSRRTLEREETEAKERWYEEYQEELTRFSGRLVAKLADTADLLRSVLQCEAAAREAGQFEQEDGYRQLADRLFALTRQDPDNWVNHGAEIRKMMDDAVNRHRISFLPYGPPKDVEPGPRHPERAAAREDAQRLIAKARAMWRAATDEEAWAAFMGRELSLPADD